MITTRNVKIEDYKFINKWWNEWGESNPPRLRDLPNDGLGGVIVEKNGKPICVNYIYLTNSSVAYLANAVSNPNYKSKDRFEIIKILLEECERRVITLGYSILWMYTVDNGVMKRCKESGFHIVKEKQNLITKIYGKNR